MESISRDCEQGVRVKKDSGAGSVLHWSKEVGKIDDEIRESAARRERVWEVGVKEGSGIGGMFHGSKSVEMVQDSCRENEPVR